MHVETRHSPSFAVSRVTLEPNEQLKAESGAMMAMSAGVGVQPSTQGGVMKGLKRSVLGGESLFITTFTAPPTGGWVDVAHFLSGDIIVAGVLPDQPMFVTKGCWLASSGGVELDTKWGGFKNMFGGEGGFLIHATGPGHDPARLLRRPRHDQPAAGRAGHDRQRPRRRLRADGHEPAAQGRHRADAVAEVAARASCSTSPARAGS